MLVTCTKPDIDQLHRTHLFRRQIKGLDFSAARGSCAKQLEPISFRQIEYSSTQSLGRCIFNGEANVSVIQRLGSVLVDCIAAALQLVGLSPARRFYSAHRFSVRERKVKGGERVYVLQVFEPIADTDADDITAKRNIKVLSLKKDA